MKKSLLIIAIATIIGCSQKPVYQSVTGFAQGTTYAILYNDNGIGDLKIEIEELLNRFDASLSNYNDSSILSRVNRGEDVEVDDWFVNCFNASMQVYQQTDNLFDPSLRPLINAYGFGAKGKKEFRVLDSVQLEAILQNVGLNKIKIDNKKVVMPDSMSLDFSAIAQGYSSDLVAQMFDSLGIENYIVEIGGEIYAKGVNAKGKSWRVGIDTPKEGNFIAGASIEEVVELDKKGLATSGNYRKFFEIDGKKYSHEINPKTGLCSRDSLLSATIIAPNAALADGYATACMVGGYAWSVDFAKRLNLQAYLIYQNHKGEMVTIKL